MVPVVDMRRFLNGLRLFAELKDFLLRLSAESAALIILRGNELGVVAGISFKASS